MRFFELVPGLLHYLTNEEETLLRKIAIESYPNEYKAKSEREDVVGQALVHRGIITRKENGFLPSKGLLTVLDINS